MFERFVGGAGDDDCARDADIKLRWRGVSEVICKDARSNTREGTDGVRTPDSSADTLGRAETGWGGSSSIGDRKMQPCAGYAIVR